MLDLVSGGIVAAAPEPSGALSLARVGTTPRAAEFDAAAAEAVAVIPNTAQVFVVDSSSEILRFHSIGASGALSALGTLDVLAEVTGATGINSIAIARDTLAVALEVREPLFQPDAVHAYTAAHGHTYYVTANEGDGRYENLYTFGARSFSIFDANGVLVFDSGSQFEAITAKRYGASFNNNHASHDPDGRSDAKGPEPEALLVATIDDGTYAFIGLERMGGVMVYDVTDPREVEFVTYFNPRHVGKDPEEDDLDADLGPEGFAFLSAAESPTGRPLLIAGNEVSGNTSVYEITLAP